MRQRNIYLEKINPDIHSYGINWKHTGFHPIRRTQDFMQRRKCGYDYRVTYNLDSWMIEQLYTWLNMYLEASYNTIDLEYHKFNIDGMELTELEAIVYIVDSFERWLICTDDTSEFATEEEDAAREQVKKAFAALGTLWPALWW
jgi:hypothetical protein